MISKVERLLRDRSRSSPYRPPDDSRPEPWPHLLNPDRLPDHIDQFDRAAWALCGSQHDVEDLGQGTFANVLKRPRLLRDDHEIGYLPRALKIPVPPAAERPRAAQSLVSSLTMTRCLATEQGR
jgi:hypothetical protein